MSNCSKVIRRIDVIFDGGVHRLILCERIHSGELIGIE